MKYIDLFLLIFIIQNQLMLNLELKIQLFQKKISYNLRRIIDMINIDFINTFCHGNELVCAFPDGFSRIDHDFYLASKLRVSLNYLQSLLTITQSMIGDNTLYSLYLTEFIQLFQKKII